MPRRVTIINELKALRARSPDALREGGRFVLNPPQLERLTDASTRVTQIVALCFLPVVIIVSFELITAAHAVISGIFGANPPTGAQFDIIGFLLTAITAGMLILAAWTWFQFVRTSGFGLFAWK